MPCPVRPYRVIRSTRSRGLQVAMRTGSDPPPWPILRCPAARSRTDARRRPACGAGCAAHAVRPRRSARGDRPDDPRTDGRQMRLVWWHDALERLDTAAPPAEPLLQDIARLLLPRGVSGAALAAMTDGWEELVVTDPLDDQALARHADSRGGTLFALAGRLLGAEPAVLRIAGQGWAYADLARHLTVAALADHASAQARATLSQAFTATWPAPVRAVGVLALLARSIWRAARRSPRRGASRASASRAIAALPALHRMIAFRRNREGGRCGDIWRVAERWRRRSGQGVDRRASRSARPAARATAGPAGRRADHHRRRRRARSGSRTRDARTETLQPLRQGSRRPHHPRRISRRPPQGLRQARHQRRRPAQLRRMGD